MSSAMEILVGITILTFSLYCDSTPPPTPTPSTLITLASLLHKSPCLVFVISLYMFLPFSLLSLCFCIPVFGLCVLPQAFWM